MLFLRNANILTMDEAAPQADTIVFADGIIKHVGAWQTLSRQVAEQDQVIDLEGKTLMPGFIEGHAHFVRIGRTAKMIDLSNCKSWSEVLGAVEDRVSKSAAGAWVCGYGWHQAKWTDVSHEQVNGYPVHEQLSTISPDNPVYLIHASIHSLMANQKAMDIAELSPQQMADDLVLKRAEGLFTGIFEEESQSYILSAANSLDPAKRKIEIQEAIELATELCIRNGISSFHDMACTEEELLVFKELDEQNALRVRMNLVLWAQDHRDLLRMCDQYTGADYQSDFLRVQSVKAFADGALGSRGAWLKQEYNDEPGHFGQQIISEAQLTKLAEKCLKNSLQLVAHAIGDAANSMVLDVYEKVLAGDKSLRWRIEHAQNVVATDIPRFSRNGIVASVQTVHCTSDAPYLHQKLGVERAEAIAYRWADLLAHDTAIANGTDAPVESLSVMENLHAAVTRKPKHGPAFVPEQCMTMPQALRSYTWGNAYAAFEEESKGVLIKGAFADFVILSGDPLEVEDIRSIEVEALVIAGKLYASERFEILW